MLVRRLTDHLASKKGTNALAKALDKHPEAEAREFAARLDEPSADPALAARLADDDATKLGLTSSAVSLAHAFGIVDEIEDLFSTAKRVRDEGGSRRAAKSAIVKRLRESHSALVSSLARGIKL